ncbi:MAG: PKD domain-containing protein [Bacteroidia bacterium]|nr:PKD domain-containing protein [Bacteroidia bacterium]
MLTMIVGFSNVKASHNMGVDLTYECLNNCTIRVHLRAYRDCSGISTIPANLTFTPAPGQSGCIAPAPVTAWSAQLTTEVTPICPTAFTKCTNSGASINGVQEFYWWRDYDICSATCSLYVMSFSDCCRNGAITTGPSGNIFINATTLNTSVTPCNSSPQFSNPPVPYICLGNTFVFNQGAFDPDGDSLVYYLGPCSTAASTPVTYTGGASPTSPLGPDWTVVMDSATGDITITPTPGSIQVAVMCVYVQEWRNGQLINTIVRDMQITVLNCANTNPYIEVDTVIGGTQPNPNQFEFYTCTGSNFSLNILGWDADSVAGPSGPAQNICMFWDKNIPGAHFFSCTNPNDSDTVCSPPIPICATFQWNPMVPGKYTFLVTIIDDGCPILGVGQYTFVIHVGGLVVSHTLNVPGCGPVDLCASAIGNEPITFNWTGSGGLSTNPNHTDSCFQHTYPGPGTYPLQLTVTDSVGCPLIQLDTVIIPQTTVANAGSDISYCSGSTGNLGGPPTPNEIYQWIPTTGLNDPSLSNPTVTLTNTGLTPQVITYIIIATDTSTSCVDMDTVLVTVYPIPVAQFIMPPSVCQYDQVNVTYTGPNGPSATYNWNFGSGAIPPTATGIGPHTVNWQTAGNKGVTLTVSQFGCTSPTFTDSITVFPQPIASIASVAGQCIQGNLFNFINTGTYQSNATFAWTFFPDAVIPASVAENPTGIEFTTSGGKYATLQITENGCVSNTDTIQFQVFPMPSSSWIVVGSPQCQSDNNYCFNSTGVNNGPSATYAWSFTDATPATSTATNPCGIVFNDCGWKNVTLTVTENGCSTTTVDSIFILCNPDIDAGLNVSFCEGSGGAQLVGTITGGTPQYYWTWWCDSAATWCGLDSVNDNDPIANPTQTTWYYVQIVDFNGCTSNIDSALVTVLPRPIVDAGPDMYICADSAPCTILQASITGAPGPYSYQWSPAAGLNSDTILNPCARPDTTTIYTLVVTSLSNGCSSNTTTVDSNSTVTVHVQPLPIAHAHSAPETDICLGDSVELQGYGYGAGPNYIYQWSPASGLSSVNVPNPKASPSQTTDYILTVWSNSCPSYGDTVTVNVHTNPTVDAGPVVEICLGENGQLDGEAFGDPTSTGYSFYWWPNTGFVSNVIDENPWVSPPTTTTYYVIATSSWGCESAIDSTQLVVKPSPIAEAGENQIICEGMETQLLGSYTSTTGMPPANQVYYQWSPSDSLSNTTVLQPMADPTVSTTYTLTVTYNLCTSTDEVLITVIPGLNAQADRDTSVICGGDSVGIYSSGGLGAATFTWIPAAGVADPHSPNTMASPSVSTVYQIVLEEGGCTDTAEVSIDVIPSPTVAYINSPPTGCVPFDVNFLELTSDAVAWTWNFGDGSPVSNAQNPTHTFTEPGSYTVTLTGYSAGNCDATASTTVVLVQDTATADFSSNPNHPASLPLPNSSVQFTDLSVGASSWFWDFGDGFTSSVENPGHMYAAPGEYWVTLSVTNANGCVTEVMHGPFIVTAPELFIPNVFTPNGDGFNDEFVVNYTGSQPFTMTITDRWGVEHFSSRDKNEGWKGNSSSPLFSGNAMPEGVYYYRIQIGSKTFVGDFTMLR